MGSEGVPDKLGHFHCKERETSSCDAMTEDVSFMLLEENSVLSTSVGDILNESSEDIQHSEHQTENEQLFLSDSAQINKKHQEHHTENEQLLSDSAQINKKTQSSNRKTASTTTPSGNKKYTSSFIQAAAESYNQAQESRYAAALKNAEAIESLSAALRDYTAVCRDRNEIEKLKAEAEIIKANALLVQAKTEQIKLKIDSLHSLDFDYSTDI